MCFTSISLPRSCTSGVFVKCVNNSTLQTRAQEFKCFTVPFCHFSESHQFVSEGRYISVLAWFCQNSGIFTSLYTIKLHFLELLSEHSNYVLLFESFFDVVVRRWALFFFVLPILLVTMSQIRGVSMQKCTGSNTKTNIRAQMDRFGFCSALEEVWASFSFIFAFICFQNYTKSHRPASYLSLIIFQTPLNFSLEQ